MTWLSLCWPLVTVYGLWRAARLAERGFAHRERIVVTQSVSAERIAEITTIAPREDQSLEIAKIHAQAALDVARLQHPERAASAQRPSEIVLPDDLDAHVMGWTDEWARDDERESIRRKYLEFHTGDPDETWQKVRRAIGIGEMPA